MEAACKSPGCKLSVPEVLAGEGLCVAHFAGAVEQACADLRRETALRPPVAARREEIEQYIAGRGEVLARIATSGLKLPDEMKARILNTFLTLMNLRENLDRSQMRAR